jgi:DNA polymerase-3 subunit epsilon
VLRRLNLARDPRFTRKASSAAKVALCLDTETTGLDHTEDKVIELGIVAFEYNPETGEIIGITDRYSGFEDPGMPLPKEIKEITGITDEMVADQEFATDQVLALAQKASLVIAHNAAFDRKFVEKRFPVFATLPWACSVSQIDWAAEKINSRSLEYLLIKCGGYCINAHRALEDAEGVLGLLLGTLPVSNVPIFKALLEKAFATTAKIAAVGSPFETKDVLKQRGYRWNDGSRGGSKAWWTVVPEHEEQQELAYLAKEIYPSGTTRQVVIKRIDALTRFSVREE